MTCKIERPSPKSLFKNLSNLFSANVLGGAPIIPESNEFYVVANDYAAMEQFYSLSDQAWREHDPRYACCENLTAMAALDGIYPKPASFASGYVRMTGTPNAALSQNMQFQFGGITYLTINTVPVTLGATGAVVVQVRALEPGPAANNPGTTRGTLTTVLPGVSTTVNMYGSSFCGGAIAEECEQFRFRYLERMRYKPNIGLDQVLQKAMEWPCVTRVCERGGVCCDTGVQEYQGGVDCNKPINLYVLMEDTFTCGLPPQNVVDNISEWLFGIVQGIGSGQAPWGMYGKVYYARAAKADIVIDGLACATPGAANEIRNRITEFVARNCPSEPILLSDINVIIAQVLSNTTNYTVLLKPLDSGSALNQCGDLEPKCDYRICLNSIEFTNPTGSTGL
jgi:hypothetical protein